jgi:spore coat protein U-like protein
VKNRVLFVPLLALFSFGSETKAASTEGRATATIMTAISTSKNTGTSTFGDLAFGVIVPSESSGTVTISSTSDRTHNGGVELVASISGAASFNISGAANTPYTVTLPGTDTIKISSGSDTMQIHSFSVSSTSSSPRIGSDGKDTFNVGGKLEVGENQPAGNYTGTFIVTVAYQ